MTLAELLLRRRLEERNRSEVDSVYRECLFERERQVLHEHFKCGLHETGVRRAATRNLEGELNYIVWKFRHATKTRLQPSRERAPMEYIARDIYEAEDWYRTHPGGPPPPPRPRKIVITELPFFSYAKFLFDGNPSVTVEQIMNAVGSQATKQKAQLVLQHLRKLSPPESQRTP